MQKCAYRFGAPDAAKMVRTATPVLHDGRMKCLPPCLGRQPAETGGHFPHATAWGKRERERGGGGRERVRWVADLKLPHMVGRSSTMPGRGACPLLEDGAGLARRGRHRRELEWMEAARMYRQRSLCGKWSYIEPDAESDGAAPCSAAESLRPGGDDAEVGPETAPQDRQAAHHATQTQVAAP